MRAALYERVSTEEQKMHGLSLEAQKEALEAYAKERSMLIVGHYTDAGVSGQKPISKRPALQRLIVRQDPVAEEPIGYTVYITRTGEKYNRSGCRYLSRSKIAIDRDEAISRGYTACKVCRL